MLQISKPTAFAAKPTPIVAAVMSTTPVVKPTPVVHVATPVPQVVNMKNILFQSASISSLDLLFQAWTFIKPKKKGTPIIPHGETQFRDAYQDIYNSKSFFYIPDFSISTKGNEPLFEFDYFGFSKGYQEKGADIKINLEARLNSAAKASFEEKLRHIEGATLACVRQS